MRRNKEREKEKEMEEEENRMEEKLFKDINVWSWNQEEVLVHILEEEEDRRRKKGE